MHAVKEILTGKSYTCLVEKQKSLKGFVSRTIKTSKTTNNILLIDMFYTVKQHVIMFREHHEHTLK